MLARISVRKRIRTSFLTGTVNIFRVPKPEETRRIVFNHFAYLAADLGYFDTNDQRESLMKHDVAVVTEINKITVIPEHCGSKGKSECEEGHPLVLNGFDKDTYEVWLRGDMNSCAACPKQGTCEK